MQTNQIKINESKQDDSNQQDKQLQQPQQRVNLILRHLTAGGSNTINSTGKSYRFTRSAGILTEEQRQQYDRDGFFVIKGLVPQDDLNQYTDHFIKISSVGKPTTRTMIVMRDIAIAKTKGVGEKAITKIQDWQEDDILFGYCRHPNLLPYVTSIVGPDIRSVHTMLINKPPDVGIGSSRHPPHQDLW